MKNYTFSATTTNKTFRTDVWADTELEAVVAFKNKLIASGWTKEQADNTPFKKHF